MLSRTAESVFGIGRSVERADGTARLLDVHLQLLNEEPWIEEDLACRSLLGVLGASVPDDERLTRADVLGMLAVDRHNAASIAYSLGAAREDARRAREFVSTELWECLNTTRARMPRKVASDKVHEFFGWVRERSALAVGIIESTTSHDETWNFFTLGRSIERANLTARLLASRMLTEVAGPSWTTILRSCGAYEPYLHTHRGVPSARTAAEFLLLDPSFPRSVLFSVRRAEQCLREVEPATERAGTEDDAQRLLGGIRSSLEVAPVAAILEDLPSRMEQVRQATTEVSDAIRARYFPTDAAPSWAGGR
ncbi:alpha-E domain-containing protein [Curtobacterium sp. MCBD17_013]|uniref:alpha-E domain-containing protein n=1 Tax=Curtobacterium sp. MCBD17_013 TaxID=2175668 RepID=UPI000DA70D1A|nr:alpha-E domain-containing protein [Curtobacterium sp. MCBD17_013]PZF63364.1 alpha-E domain-containing protein [Curtobacterium sp. MCBD17_013]